MSFARMVSPDATKRKHAANFQMEIGDAVHCLKLFVVLMVFIVVLTVINVNQVGTSTVR